MDGDTRRFPDRGEEARSPAGPPGGIRDLLAEACEQVEDAISITDTRGDILYVNQGFERCTGYRREEVLGKNTRILKSGRHGPEFYRNLWAVITSGRVFRSRITNRKKDGSLHDLDITISAVRDPDGRIGNYVAVRRDVTAQLQAERRLALVQKLEALGVLGGGIAHDFNNILAAIMGFTEISLLKLPPGAEGLRGHLANILGAARRGADLVRHLLAFCRLTETGRQPLELQSVLKETVRLLRSSLPSTIRIRSRFAAEGRMVLADPARMHQMIMNLCVNAADAMGMAGGTLDLGLAEVGLDAGTASRIPPLAPGPHLVLTVSDTGGGIPPEIIDRVFDPFFTTKEPGQGTGLGLSMVHGVAAEHQGAVQVRSAPGQGACFEVYLPLAPRAGEGDPVPSPAPARRARILVVDDEVVLCLAMTEMLEGVGHAVTARSDPAEALGLIRRDPGAFDLVITDQTMPGMTGATLCLEIRALRPDLPVILCTGYGDLFHGFQSGDMGIRDILRKPLRLAVLAEAVARALACENPVGAVR